MRHGSGRITADLPVHRGHPPYHAGARRSCLAGLDIDQLTEAQVTEHIARAVQRGRGGWVVTLNIDICRLAARDRGLRELVRAASLVVPDGMPLLWAAKLRGEPLPERVTGASLLFSVTSVAAREGRSIYLLGGRPGVPERAAVALSRRYPGLEIVGTDAPPPGFDTRDDEWRLLARRLGAARPDIVYVGMGFPKQERLIARIGPSFPATWFIGCGAALPFAAGVLPRAPLWMQRAGLEWAFRLAIEPRRLFRRYLVRDLPFAAMLLVRSGHERLLAHDRLPPGLSVPRDFGVVALGHVVG
jgi:N-acetylglucosaminyldiphosphoundecaprenol N-acetyl-beta-D-mannosaminyltransferase